MSETIDRLAEALRAARVKLTPNEEALASAVYRRLAKGAPASAAELAADTGREEAWVSEVLERFGPGVFRSGDGRVVGFWGIATSPMDHALTVDGTTVYTWCAWDALFIPPILGTRASVASHCPVTGTPITLRVDRDGVRDLDPPTTVMSMVEPGDMKDVVTEFCHRVLFFASPEAGERWAADHPDAHIISLDEGFDLGQRARLFGAEEVST